MSYPSGGRSRPRRNTGAALDACYHRRMKLASLLVAISALCLAALTGGAHADEPMYACHARAADSKMHAFFQKETSLDDLGVWVMGFTCKTVIFSPEVAKHATRVTILAPNEMTPKQAVQLFVDAVDATGLVVTQKADTITIKLGPGMPRTCPDTTVANAPPPVPEPSVVPAVDALDPALLDAGIKRTDATHVTVTRAVLDAVLANPMAAANGARVVPAVANGKPAGFKLYAIRPSSVYARIGLLNGDTITAINGFELDSADKALAVYVKLRETTALEIAGVRQGQPLALFLSIH